jgi:CRISPR-associated protein Cmr2
MISDQERVFWQAKLAARLHDPAEKALVLLRDPEGHEGGTSRALTRLLGLVEITGETLDPDSDEVLSSVIFRQGLPRDIYKLVKRADWWAAAADRPQWPMEEVTVTTKTGAQRTCKVAHWAQVDWAGQPVLTHPLSGRQYALPGGLRETDIADVKRRSFEHFSRLLVTLGAQDETSRDLRKILLAFWRFGPELVEDEDFGRLGELWRVLPADTRVPDHSIWDHLDLVSAFAGAFAADPSDEAALLALALSIGPVQAFIAAGRTTSDLWAGSHLLSRLAWEAMRPLCEALGPDAILFPRLRGIPQVDLWLRGDMGLPRALFAGCEWLRRKSDANPLFAAALPNRFVAVVPASQAREIAEKAGRAARAWLQGLGRTVVDRLLAEAGMETGQEQHCHRQAREQLEGFPEVHWAAVPFGLIHPRDAARQTDLDVSALSTAMAPFFGLRADAPCGFLATPAWEVLRQDMAWGDGTAFFAPNPGVLYPAVYDLAERVLAAAKAARPFEQMAQRGWRDSLTGESEWLTPDPGQLDSPSRLRTDTLWARVAARRPAWARKGEHLGALSAVKRLWPTLFAEEVSRAIGRDVSRFVVSTHTMALASQLDRWLERGGRPAEGFPEAAEKAGTVALPRRLVTRHSDSPALDDARRIPAILEAAQEADDEGAYERARRLVEQTLARGADGREKVRLETYYALVMLDGDHMGRILSGDEAAAITYLERATRARRAGDSPEPGDEAAAITYLESFHPQVQRGFTERATGQPLIHAYGNQKRAVSPNRHLAISGALNDFSQIVVPHVVEEEHSGRVIYAGGDDVLAMLPVADLLPAMKRLRHAYSGTVPEDEPVDWGDLQRRRTLVCKSGFAYLRGRLMRMMGEKATASCGAVVAHHQAPMGMVLRELRAAEQRAKREGGRDAFSLTVIKRSGGMLVLTARWGEPLEVLGTLRAFLADPEVSRRAVYHCLEWLAGVPMTDQAMLGALLAYQFDRQAREPAKKRHDVAGLARRVAAVTFDPSSAGPEDRRARLTNLLCVAEFLARESRTAGQEDPRRRRAGAGREG